MHTHWNRIVSLVLTFALLLTCAPWAYAAEREDAPVPAEEEPVLEELSP